MIAIEAISKHFGTQKVLKEVSLKIATGTTHVVLGLSGSGKSVLMKLIIGLLQPDGGRIMVDNEDISHLHERDLRRVRRKFGMVFQQAALFDSMTVGDNVAFPLREHTSLKPAEIRQKVAEKLEMLGLSGTEHKFPAELSGGMRKRVGLARAVILNPQYVLYDEPTTGLDPLTTESVDDMIREAKKALGVTSVVISHDIGSALKVGDNIAVLHDGHIVEDCTSQAIRQSRSPFVQRFLETWFAKQ